MVTAVPCGYVEVVELIVDDAIDELPKIEPVCELIVDDELPKIEPVCGVVELIVDAIDFDLPKN